MWCRWIISFTLRPANLDRSLEDVLSHLIRSRLIQEPGVPVQRELIIAFFIAAVVAPASAQERPFIFSIGTESESKPAVRFDYDVGVGERVFQSDISNQPEQRIGLQASLGRSQPPRFAGRATLAI